MKTHTTIWVIILSVLVGCIGCKQSNPQSDELITIDVTAKYPKKELILQDFMDVEYIPLETNDDFLCQGLVMAIGKEIIVVKNARRDGNLYLFDRNGKSLRKINRMGNSGEEYVYYNGIILDEDNNELFVNSSSKKTIMVYDLYGNYKRSIKYKEDALYSNMLNYDKEHFIWWNSAFEWYENSVDMPSFFIASKQDGSIVKEIKIPFEQRKSTVQLSYDEKTKMTYALSTQFYSINSYQDQFILMEPSTDTVYSFSANHSMTPFMVRTPSIQSMKPEIFLFPGTFTDQYYFMFTAEKKSDGSETDLVYDRKAKALFKYTLYNDDYTNKKHLSLRYKNVNDEIAYWEKIEAFMLVNAYRRGQLKGQLKEIAAGLNEESNPVIMFVKHKK